MNAHVNITVNGVPIVAELIEMSRKKGYIVSIPEELEMVMTEKEISALSREFKRLGLDVIVSNFPVESLSIDKKGLYIIQLPEANDEQLNKFSKIFKRNIGARGVVTNFQIDALDARGMLYPPIPTINNLINVRDKLTALIDEELVLRKKHSRKLKSRFDIAKETK